jgi:uncharacterized protein YkwD
MASRVLWTVCVLLVLGLPAVQAQTGPAWRQGWLALLNQERAFAGVPPLRLVPVLVQVAQEQAEEMAPGRGWRLRQVSAATVAERLRQVGYTAHDWREDFVLLTEDPQIALRSWRKEGSHPIFDKRFRDLGIGAVRVGGFPLYVFLFGWHEGDYFAQATAGLRDRARVAAEMLERINAIRRREGLPPLVSDPLLDRVAQEHADDMLARSYSGHRTPEGRDASERALAAGYPSGIGENIVEQRFSVDAALEAWLSSPGHRRNILDPGCREMGFGLAIGKGYDAALGGYRVIWVQNLGRAN